MHDLPARRGESCAQRSLRSRGWGRLRSIARSKRKERELESLDPSFLRPPPSSFAPLLLPADTRFALLLTSDACSGNVPGRSHRRRDDRAARWRRKRVLFFLHFRARHRFFGRRRCRDGAAGERRRKSDGTRPLHGRASARRGPIPRAMGRFRLFFVASMGRDDFCLAERAEKSSSGAGAANRRRTDGNPSIVLLFFLIEQSEREHIAWLFHRARGLAPGVRSPGGPRGGLCPSPPSRPR